MILKSQKGFTLIEIMIAITLLAFVVLGIGTISGNSITTKERVTQEDNNLLEIQTALSRMEWDFSHIYSPLYFSIKMQQNDLDEEGNEIYAQFLEQYTGNYRFKKPSYEALPIPEVFNEDKDDISFLTLANRRKYKNQKQSHFAWIRYYLESNDSEEDYIISGTKVLKRSFLADDVFNKEEIDWEKGAKSQVLLENVEKMQLEWWDTKSKKWVDSLRSIQEDKEVIRGVKITLTLKLSEEDSFQVFRIYKPLFPFFKSENFYELEKIKDDAFLSQEALSEFE